MNYFLTDAEANYILELLAERPYKESAGLVENIQMQYAENVAVLQEEEAEKQRKLDELDKKQAGGGTKPGNEPNKKRAKKKK